MAAPSPFGLMIAGIGQAAARTLLNNVERQMNAGIRAGSAATRQSVLH
jgi:hypothetical protein